MSFSASDQRGPVDLGPLGLEIELLAPPGNSREDLAKAIARHHGGNVRRFFHPQGEPSKAPNTPFFENLTLGFAVEDAEGRLLAQCVDDLTLQDDLDRRHPPRPGWYRIVSDDSRMLHLTMRQADPTAPLETVLQPIAGLFGTQVEEGVAGMRRVADVTGAPIVLGATLPGERERPCELITPPIASDHLHQVETLLGLALELGFTVPAEGAIHIHFDGAPLCHPVTVAHLVRFFSAHGEALKDHFGTNPRCRRLGGWPPELLEFVSYPGFLALDWEGAREQLIELKLTKYCDFNLRNLVLPLPDKHTFEVRILPVWLDAVKILEAATVFAGILGWAKDHAGGGLKPVPEDLSGFLNLQPQP